MGEDELNWNVETEVNLFHAMRNHKPVGVNRHFHMVCIISKLCESLGRNVTSKQIWDHLASMYDLCALNESENLPFPNKEKDFLISDPVYDNLMAKEFPRAASEPTKTNDSKSAVKSALNTPVIASGASNVLSASLTEDTPKREQRKRTRHAGPASAESTPVAPKRVRRL